MRTRLLLGIICYTVFFYLMISFIHLDFVWWVEPYMGERDRIGILAFYLLYMLILSVWVYVSGDR